MTCLLFCLLAGLFQAFDLQELVLAAEPADQVDPRSVAERQDVRQQVLDLAFEGNVTGGAQLLFQAFAHSRAIELDFVDLVLAEFQIFTE